MAHTISNTAQKTKAELLTEITHVILDAVNLKHLDASMLGASTGLGQGGLGLDSVDILEVVVTLENRYGVKVKDPSMGKKIFQTLGSIADWIHESKLPVS